MCGIAGYCEAHIDEHNTKNIEKMLDVIQHRGPDGRGIFKSEKIIMGMQRLSIIDLVTGDQPIYNETGDVAIVCNGEIYNYIELRQALIERGHKFKTKSDVEVIVHLYEEYGTNCVTHLNGMFAFALWDSSKERLLLARDRMGEKPLFYYHKGEQFLFGSEIKSLLHYPGFLRKVNFAAMNELLTYNYIPFPKTMFQDIYRIPPGCFLVYQGETVHIESYWDIPWGDTVEKKEEKYCQEMIELLQDSIHLRFRSDVPVGAFLSGGVDSSGVVGIASLLLKQRCKTFSIGFTEEAFNELPYANFIAEHYQTKHYTEIVKNDGLEQLPQCIWYSDNPHGDVSFIPTLKVSSVAQKHVKVVLTGDGGDELFAGYDKYWGFLNKYGEKADAERYLEFTSVFSQGKKRQLCHKEIYSASDASIPLRQMFDKTAGQDILHQMLHFDLKMLLEGNNLVKPDRMGMGKSIEPRVPFLDHRFIEYISTIPSHWKLRDGTTKYILKKALEPIVPKHILYAKKRMFTVPIGEWFKHEMKSFMYDLMNDKRTQERGYFDRRYIQNMMDNHSSGKGNFTRELRLLLIIELWHRIFIDNLYDHPPALQEIL